MIEERFLKTIRRFNLIPDSSSILCAVSGGPDSTALLHLLVSHLPSCSVTGVYINHNLRPEESETEIHFLKDLCRKLEVAFMTSAVDVKREKKSSGRSLEDCGRRLRYHALEEIRSSINADLIAVGHNRDDQAEEVLIRLIRGTGGKGLEGMACKTGRIIRPLLDVPRSEILKYLKNNRLGFCLDSSNESRDFLRNRVRLDLLPFLEKNFNPAIRQTLLNTAAILREDQNYLDHELERLYRLVSVFGNAEQDGRSQDKRFIDSKAFSDIHPAMQRRIFERLLWELGCRPTFKTIERLRSLTIEGRTGTQLHLPGRVRAVKTADGIYCAVLANHQSDRDNLGDAFAQEIRIDGPGHYQVEALKAHLHIALTDRSSLRRNTLAIDAFLVDFPLFLRAAQPGERFKPLGAPGRKKIFRLLSDRKIPCHLRHQYPVLVSNDRIIAIAGLTIADDFRIGPESTQVIEIDWRVKPDSGNGLE